MKRFILSVLCVSVFFTGLGVLVEKSSATLKSDDRALEILRRARQAVGGEAALGGVRSMSITGKVAKTFEIEGAARSENGEVEINFELPNKMSRKIKFGSGDANVLIDKQVDVLVTKKIDGSDPQFKTGDGDGTRKFTIVKKDGTSEDVPLDGRTPVVIRKIDGDASEDGQTAETEDKKVVVRRMDGAVVTGEKMRSNELFRTTLSLLLSAPEDTDVSYTYAGEGSVDGALCDIVAASDGGSVIKLYFDRSTSLPRMMTFQGPKPFMIFMRKADDQKPTADGEKTRVFTRRLEAPEMAEFQVKFSDYRAVNGIQLPFRWTQTIGGKADEVIDITAYEINPANIAEKLKEAPARTFVRVKIDQ